MVGLSCQSVHVKEVFPISSDKPVGTATCSCAYILRGVANGVGRAIGQVDNGAIGCSHDNLGTPVLVPIIRDDVLLVILEVTHVRPAVHPPQACAVLLQALKDGVLLCVNAIYLRAVLGIRLLYLALVVELHQDFQFSVAIHIGTCGIIRNEVALDAFVLQRDFLVARAPRCGRITVGLLRAVDDGPNGVLVVCRATRILII